MGTPLTIYVAGPYTADTNLGKLNNVFTAIRICLKLIHRGHIPFCPHLTHYVDKVAGYLGIKLSWEFWMRYDEVWLDKCDALYFIGPSRGASRERRRAEEAGKPVFIAVGEVEDLGAPEDVQAGS